LAWLNRLDRGKRGIGLALVVALLAWFALPAGNVQAHAELIGSNPAPGQTVTHFPTTVELDFSENVDLGSARFELLNASGEVVAVGKARLSPSSPLTLLVDFPSQPDGVYSLAWQVISAVDGHETNGTVAFSVGLNSPQASLLPPPGTPDPATDLPPAGLMIFRWLAYVTIAVALGSALFGMLVWRRAYRSASCALSQLPGAPEALVEWDEQVTRLLRYLGMFGAIGVLFSLSGDLLLISLAITPSETAPVWQTLLQNFSLQEGRLVWVRLAALPLMAVFSALLPSAGRGKARGWWGIIGLGLVLELTYSLSGHNAALGSPLPVIDDWLHFTAMSAWIGGLLPLGILLLGKRCPPDPDEEDEYVEEDAPVREPIDPMAWSEASTQLLSYTSQRFSRMALAAVIVLGLSGVYSALLQVKTLQALLSTRYGQAILVKSGLFAAFIGLGALNQRGILPRIATTGQRALTRLGKSVRVELMLGALVLLAAGGLTSLAPAYLALQTDHRYGMHVRWSGDNVTMDFRLAPVKVGDNEFAVDIVDRRPGAQNVVGTALLRIQAADGSTGATQVEAKLTTDHRYSARGSYFSKMGTWDVLVIWRKPNFDDVTHVFTVDLAKWAQENGQTANPVPATSASVDDGHTLYLTHCASCHGVAGKGDGPAGRSLNPAPSDLTVNAAPGVHTDGELFNWISTGYPNSAMPAFQNQLTEKQRWDVVNFLRVLAQLR
jgi:copper transport protein